MSPVTRIICLANSRKHGDRCIAGIDPSTGAWIRPVSDLDDGRIERATRIIDGREPALGDILEIPLAPDGPDFGFECENRRILPGTWKSPAIAPLTEILGFRSNAPVILHTDESYVTVEHLKSLPRDQRKTLQLVEATDLHVFSAGPSAHGGRKWRATFTPGSGKQLKCMITDPVLMDKLESGYVPGPHALLTISLSMPYRPAEWEGEETPCWKLVAGIIELQRNPTPRTMAPASSARFPSRIKAHHTFIDDEQITEALAGIFGFHAFRPGQGDIVKAVLDGRDVFAVMPTGGGKSLCYQLPACLLSGTCMVVSPLISLMKDQVDAARSNGIRAAYLNSSLTEQDRVDVIRKLSSGALDLIYVSPERFALDPFLSLLSRVEICFAAIDEAHCISEWGHDFRPDYLHLSELVKRFPHIPIAAFTATATRKVQDDIISRLGLRNPHVLRASFNRPNLFYEVVPKVDEDAQILDFIKQRKDQAGIVYRTTRKSVQETDEMLRLNGIRSLPYHAGLEDGVREKNQEAFSRDEVDVVVATIAFGMGIDKSNVRYVVHGDLPKNIENYYQETGRAGRDGERAHCLLLYSPGDIPRIRFFIDKVQDEQERRRLRTALDEMVAFAGVKTCRRAKLLSYFGEVFPDSNCGGCDNCGIPTEETVVTTEARIALSAVVHAQERFGAAHIVDIITGAKTKRIREFGHDRLKTYAEGKGRPKKFWRSLVDDLIEQELIVRTDGEYPVLKLGDGAQEVLQGNRDVRVRRPIEEIPKTTPVPEAAPEENQDLFDLLRIVRRELAEQRKVPAFVIFSDRTVHEMAAQVPRTKEELLAITGVGAVKLAQFGDAFLKVTTEYAQAHPDRVSVRPPRPEHTSRPKTPIVRSDKTEHRSETVEATWNLLQQGHDLTQIADARGLALTTIIGHLETLVVEGRPVPIDRFVPPSRREQIARLFRELGTELLGPVVGASDGAFGYEEARLTRAWMKAGQK